MPTAMSFLDHIDYYGMKAEFLGTFLITTISGLAYSNYLIKATNIEEFAMATGLVYCVFTMSGHLFSNAVYNPALTGVLMVFKKVHWVTGTFFIFGQLLASVFGASLIEFFTP